jgi:hypothetical protein
MCYKIHGVFICGKNAEKAFGAADEDTVKLSASRAGLSE